MPKSNLNRPPFLPNKSEKEYSLLKLKLFSFKRLLIFNSPTLRSHPQLLLVPDRK